MLLQPLCNPCQLPFCIQMAQSRRVKRKTQILLLLATATYWNPARGQTPATTLSIELQNVVEYQVDISDVSKFGTNPNITAGSFSGSKCLSNQLVALGDVVAVNGQPAKGTYTSRGVVVCTGLTANPSQPIADTSWNTIRYETYEILQSDGTPVGTVMTSGLNAGTPSPPGPSVGTQNFAIVGGTGAFVGARGQKGGRNSALNGAVTPRLASIAEDPAKRRENGGGHILSVLYVIPTSRPEIAITASGPAVTHSNDFSLVSASKPAVAGEILSLFATGLGPTRPGLNPGQPFQSNPLAVVNSPVEVTVNGNPAEVLGAVGYPGAVDGYQVNFRVPPDAPKGSSAIQVSAAWISGSEVQIAIQ